MSRLLTPHFSICLALVRMRSAMPGLSLACVSRRASHSYKVTLHEWLALLETQAKERPGIADRILTNAKQMLKWGVKRRLIPANPLAEINAREDLQIRKVAGS